MDYSCAPVLRCTRWSFAVGVFASVAEAVGVVSGISPDGEVRQAFRVEELKAAHQSGPYRVPDLAVGLGGK